MKTFDGECRRSEADAPASSSPAQPLFLPLIALPESTPMSRTCLDDSRVSCTQLARGAGDEGGANAPAQSSPAKPLLLTLIALPELTSMTRTCLDDSGDFGHTMYVVVQEMQERVMHLLLNLLHNPLQIWQTRLTNLLLCYQGWSDI